MSRDAIIANLQTILWDPTLYSAVNGKIRLRSYQQVAADAIIRSIFEQRGLSIVVMFPRQSGKNELQAQLEAYLLTVFCHTGAEIIKISPTWRPQSLNAMNRLETVLKNGPVTRGLWRKESGYIYRVGAARISFLSGEPHASIVGATASTLLEVDEAQDVRIVKYDKEIAPMAASANATRVFWGTAWTSQTLLARELRLAQQLEAQDGIRRVFRISGELVGREVPAYGLFLQEQISRLGRQHPMVRTQFFSEEIDADTGMFPESRRQLMRGSHEPLILPQPGKIYAFLIDVGGEAGGVKEGEEDREHDATALTVVEVDLATLTDPALKAPTYRVALRQAWTGLGQPALFARIKALADTWKPRRLVVDATGIGAGLAAYLQKAYPGKTRPFVFTSNSKSNLGWDFLSVCDTGRFRDYRATSGDEAQQTFWSQVAACQSESTGQTGQRIRWGVPDGSRDPGTGRAIHDDLLVSAALCALLDGEKWSRPSINSGFIQAPDPLEGMTRLGEW